MSDLDELAEAAKRTQTHASPERHHPVRMGVSPVSVLLGVVLGLACLLTVVSWANPDAAASLGADVGQLMGYAIAAVVIILLIAAGVRLGTGGRR